MLPQAAAKYRIRTDAYKMRGYDFHLSWTNGTYNGAAGNAELPEELLWL
jgi:hypothetical protein